jgi:hypothetical protein
MTSRDFADPEPGPDPGPDPGSDPSSSCETIRDQVADQVADLGPGDQQLKSRVGPGRESRRDASDEVNMGDSNTNSNTINSNTETDIRSIYAPPLKRLLISVFTAVFCALHLVDGNPLSRDITSLSLCSAGIDPWSPKGKQNVLLLYCIVSKCIVMYCIVSKCIVL